MPFSRKSTLKGLLLGLIAAILFTLAAMLLLAAALLFFPISDGLLRIINQLVKLLAIVLGVCISVPRGGERGLATGLTVALAYMVIGCVIYAVLGGQMDFPAFLGELLLGAAVGASAGVVRANMQTKKRRLTRPVHS